MDEFKFVLKSLGITALFFIVMQVKVSQNMTLENKLMASVHSSPVSKFVNDVADGGAKITKEAYLFVKGKFDKTDIQIRYPAEEKKAVSTTVQTASVVSHDISPPFESNGPIVIK